METAIAIVVLGIVFLLTLRGTIMVQAMRAALVSYRMQDYLTALNDYQAEHGDLPGDDPSGPFRYGRPAAMTVAAGVESVLAGNAQLDGFLTDPNNANGEPYMAWRDLRYAGLLDGDAELGGESALPENPFGGIYGFDQGNLGQAKGSLCVTKVPGYAAELIDKKLDDGAINKGKVVATSRFSINEHNHFAAPDTAGYDVKKTYIVCLSLAP